ncbi:uncharacterized protein IAS62_000848 [Cryptococcus decagattii]|uniref:Uncharacterized protein n=1 Tax=Cryptococcus decagattii TaxID=1859122 RepID=A0ABZ2ASM1_9TREE
MVGTVVKKEAFWSAEVRILSVVSSFRLSMNSSRSDHNACAVMTGATSASHCDFQVIVVVFALKSLASRPEVSFSPTPSLVLARSSGSKE